MTPKKARPQPEFLLIGRIVGTFGWAGEVKVWPETDFPERFSQLREIWLEKPDGARQKVQVTSSRVAPRQIRLKFAEYSSKETAAALRNALIFIRAEEAMLLPEGQFYHHQIIGLQVQDTEGKDLGVVETVLRAPAHDVYVTPLADIPARKEVVKEIDLARGVMLVEAGGYIAHSEL